LQAEILALQKTVAAQSREITALQKQATSNQTADTTSTAAIQRQVNLIAVNPFTYMGVFD
jgi:hypothetical protein